MKSRRRIGVHYSTTWRIASSVAGLGIRERKEAAKAAPIVCNRSESELDRQLNFQRIANALAQEAVKIK